MVSPEGSSTSMIGWVCDKVGGAPREKGIPDAGSRTTGSRNHTDASRSCNSRRELRVTLPQFRDSSSGGLCMSLFSLILLPLAAAAPVDLVVDLRDGISLDEARQATSLPDLAWVHPLTSDEALGQASVDEGEVAATLARLASLSEVEAAERPVAHEALGFPDDPLYSRQWNLKAIGAPVGWRAGGGVGVTVAVIDTGVTQVEDLADTTVLPGVSFVRGEPSPADANGHGTHVAGTIAQATNNGVGVAGVAPQARILPLKALSASGMGTSPWIAAAIDEAADQGAQVINLSLGGGHSKVVEIAVRKAQERGVIVVAAAGNSGRRGVGYPAALPGVFGVSAVGPEDGLAPYSSWGPGVILSAPGGDKRKPDGGILQDTVDGSGGHAFRAFQGTSMAAPHVAGAAAVLLGQTGGDEVLTGRVLREHARDLGAPGPDERFGHGRLDLAAAVRAVAIERNGLLFGLGALLALILATAGGTSAAQRRRAGLIAVCSGVAAGGVFVLPLLPVPPTWAGSFLAKPLLLWLGEVLPDPYWRNPVLLSALLPAAVTFVLGPTRTLGPVVAGLSIGMGAHLGFAAATGCLDVWLLPGLLGRCWMGLNAVLAVVCGVAAIGVSRLRDRTETVG